MREAGIRVISVLGKEGLKTLVLPLRVDTVLCDVKRDEPKTISCRFHEQLNTFLSERDQLSGEQGGESTSFNVLIEGCRRCRNSKLYDGEIVNKACRSPEYVARPQAISDRLMLPSAGADPFGPGTRGRIAESRTPAHWNSS